MTAYTDQNNGCSPESTAPPLTAPLSARELLVLQLLARGYSIEQTAHIVGETPAAILQRTATTARLLGATDWREAAAVALLCGLVI